MLKPILVLAIVCPAALAQSPKAPQQKEPHGFKADLTAKTWAELHTLVRPHDNEWRHLSVQWFTDVAAVRQKAAAEDKPIVICYTGGAGYNEPLGVC